MRMSRAVGLMVAVLVLAPVAEAKGPPEVALVELDLVANVRATCDYDITRLPSTVAINLTDGAHPGVPVVLALRAKTPAPDGSVTLVYGALVKAPAGNYLTNWNASFQARIWQFAVQQPGFYPATPQCTSRQRVDAKGTPITSVVAETVPNRALLAFIPGTKTKTFQVGLHVPGTIQAPDPVCPDEGCR